MGRDWPTRGSAAEIATAQSRKRPLARTVADAFDERSLLSDEQLEAAILRGLEAARGRLAVAAARTALSSLGYVWRPETEPRWEAGIPNLMSYVQRYV